MPSRAGAIRDPVPNRAERIKDTDGIGAGRQVREIGGPSAGLTERPCSASGEPVYSTDDQAVVVSRGGSGIAGRPTKKMQPRSVMQGNAVPLHGVLSVGASWWTIP